MLRALLRLVGFPFAFALHLISPTHYPARPGIAIDDVPGPERYVIDDGAPGPWHDRGAASRQVLAELLDGVCLRLSVRLLWLASAVGLVWAHVILRGCREGWWPVLDGFARDVVRGLVY